ncbi:MAG: hypothetical protein Q8M40_12600 [Legionella sp.]|nr:hypothetical protein [Legionella sp.]
MSATLQKTISDYAYDVCQENEGVNVSPLNVGESEYGGLLIPCKIMRMLVMLIISVAMTVCKNFVLMIM